MADATVAEPPTRPRKRRLWPRLLAWLAGILVLLLVALYLILSSSAFFTGQILPRVSQSLHADVTVSNAEINPFSQIILHDLKVQATNQPPLFIAHEARIHYNIFRVLGGGLRLDEVTLESPTLQIIRNADETSNLDPLLAIEKKSAVGKSSKPPKIDIRKLTLSNATIRRIQNHTAGSRDLVELTNLDVSITGLKNGGSGKVEFSTLIRDENNPPAPAMYGLLQAKVDGSFSYILAPDLLPETALGDAHLNISHAAGSFDDFSKLKGSLHCDIVPEAIKIVSLNFEKAGSPLGELRAEGPYDAQKAEGTLTLELLAVDKQVLNLFAARTGIDFGSTTITSTNQIELARSKATVAIAGHLRANKFQLIRTNESTPPLELQADYNVSLDKRQKAAELQTLNLSGTENGRPLLRAELASPMMLNWGNTTNAVGDSSFNLAVTKLNIEDWKTFTGSAASSGILDMNLKLFSQRGGSLLTFETTNRIQNLAGQIYGQRINDATVSFKARGRASDFHLLVLTNYNLQAGQSNQVVLTISGSGTYDRLTTNADFQLGLKATLPRVLQLINLTNVTASAGTADFKVRVRQQQNTGMISGNVDLAGITGRFSNSEFNNFGADFSLDAEIYPDQIELHKAAGTLTSGHDAGGDFKMSGILSSAKPSQLTLTFSNLNQDTIQPVLGSLLPTLQVASASLSGTISAQQNRSTDSNVKGDIDISNLVLSNTSQQPASSPLQAHVQLDIERSGQSTDIREIQISLPSTDRATNQFQIQGKVDTSMTNVTQGNLKLTASSLDLTRYYDILTNMSKASEKPNSRGKPITTDRQALETNQLPYKNFILEANVGHFYLRDLAASNFQASARLDHDRVSMKQFQFTMNGSQARATAAIDMSVPGYKYTLTFSGTNLPSAPIWDTFNPQDKGKLSGTLTAFAEVYWAGASSTNLQTLTGNFGLAATNLNLSVSRVKNPALGLLVAVVAKVPELWNNPLSTITSFDVGSVKAVLGGKLTGGFSEDLNQSPINVIAVRANAGDGRITLNQAAVQSAAFLANSTNGTVTLASALEDSRIDIPITLQVSKSLALRLPSVFPTETSGDTNYMKLPDFFSETGTLGDPTPRINAIVLGAGEARQLLTGVTGSTIGVLGNPLQSIGDYLRGSSITNHPATNPAPANTSTNRASEHMGE